MSALAPVLQAFFCGRLSDEKGASPHTIAAYRDAFRLLLGFAQQQTGKPPCKLEIEDLDAQLVSEFLDHLEHDRGNSPRTRNRVWLRSTRCSASPRCATPSTPR